MNKIYCGDNLKIMKDMESESVDLIYLDPPFFSGRNYEVIWDDDAEVRLFGDRFEGGIWHYINWMVERLEQCHRVLKPTGSIYLHVDWHAVHYLKVEMDKIFGYGNFVNEIIWAYNTSGKSKQHFGRKHDTVLVYSKSKNCIFNEQRVKDEGKNISRYNKIDEDGNRYYMRSGKYKVVYKGTVPLTDTWTDLPAITNNAKECLGYSTQKPEALLNRIIKASSNPNDIVFDPFCGCGTSAAVAKKLGRQYIGIDVSPTACKLIAKRVGYNESDIEGQPRTPDEISVIEPHEFQNWVCKQWMQKKYITKS